MVEIEKVNVTYPEGIRALSNINLQIEKGECVLLCGVSGSGKTSITKLINGLIPHFEEVDFKGRVSIDGHDIKEPEIYEISRLVSSVFQNPKTHFFNVDTTSELVFYLENIGLPREETKARLEKITRFFNIEYLLNRSIFDLSGGEKQILSIAAAYMTGTPYIVLDEPTSNLDRKFSELVGEMLKKLKEEEIGIIISEHRFSILEEVLDRVYYLKEGNVHREWTREEFFNLTEEERKSLGLRSLKHDSFSFERKEDLSDKKLVIKSLEAIFPNTNRGILIENKSFSFGSIVGVVGENGSGKSTFIKSLIGLQKKTKLSIEVGEQSLCKKEMTKESFMVMQDVNHQLFTDSVDTEVTLGSSEDLLSKKESILKELGLLECSETHPMALSGGQKQRVAIANALLSGAKIICFDEPTSGMDYSNMKKISKLIKEISTPENILFIISHDEEFLNETVGDWINLEDYSIKK